jgi:hypothetical protein
VPRIGITGHMDLSAETAELVGAAIRQALLEHDIADLIGVSCIARGADSIFAQAVLGLGGSLEVVMPAADYRDRKVPPDHLPVFDDLVHRGWNG